MSIVNTQSPPFYKLYFPVLSIVKIKQPELSKILPSVSQNDLVKFLLEKAGSDPRFYKELTIFFSQSDSKSRASYLEEVTKMYHSFLDEFDFIDYQTSFEFQKKMNRFLDQAKRLYPIKPKEALYLASACAEMALEASMNMDDTNHYTMDDLGCFRNDSKVSSKTSNTMR
ncbi:hypothetical protein [Leptospira interrogans]|uniref:hypothetical protein n=1 Tax=Leptospira interrogans TaxID=173 RepID=UPI001E62866F|nr:hypothetical protein [Leptospira interrogans]